MRPAKLLSLFLLLAASSVQGQELLNPSFEGTRGPSVSPPGWEPCGEGSTPDTQPGCWQVFTRPADGISYMSMICRGTDVPYPRRWERCQQQLSSPLRKGVCYAYSIELAHSGSFAAGGMSFGGQATLRIWGGSSSCAPEEMLWESGAISHSEWGNYIVHFQPSEDYAYLFLEAFYAESAIYSGNLLIDNFVFYPDENPCRPIVLQERPWQAEGAAGSY